MSGLTYYTGRVRLVDHDEGVVLLRQFVDLIERTYVSIHGEDTVGCDDTEPLCLSLLEFGFEVRHVTVRITVAHSLAQTHAVDDRGMVEGIRDDRILFGEQRFEQTAVGIEASGIEDGIFGSEEIRDDTLEFFVGVLCTTNETHRCHTVTTCIHAVLGCLDEFRVVRQAEVVVGTEVDHFLPALYGDSRRLRSDDHTLVLI